MAVNACRAWRCASGSGGAEGRLQSAEWLGGGQAAGGSAGQLASRPACHCSPKDCGCAAQGDECATGCRLLLRRWSTKCLWGVPRRTSRAKFGLACSILPFAARLIVTLLVFIVNHVVRRDCTAAVPQFWPALPARLNGTHPPSGPFQRCNAHRIVAGIALVCALPLPLAAAAVPPSGLPAATTWRLSLQTTARPPLSTGLSHAWHLAGHDK